VVKDSEATTTIRVLEEHLDNINKMWQKRVWDLESEVRALKNELAEMKKRGSVVESENPSSSYCEANGVPPVPSLRTQKSQVQLLKLENGGIGGAGAGASSVLNRPRARTSGAARFVNAQL
jgi:hypothetical protein